MVERVTPQDIAELDKRIQDRATELDGRMETRFETHERRDSERQTLLLSVLADIRLDIRRINGSVADAITRVSGAEQSIVVNSSEIDRLRTWKHQMANEHMAVMKDIEDVKDDVRTLKTPIPNEERPVTRWDLRTVIVFAVGMATIVAAVVLWVLQVAHKTP